MSQMTFATRVKTRADQIFDRFVIFHKANPVVWILFKQYANEMREVRDHYSGRAVWERVRWDVDFATTGESVKMNDHYFPYYTRMYLATHQEAKGFFQIRKRTSAAKPAYAVDIAVFHGEEAEGEEELMEQLRGLVDKG